MFWFAMIVFPGAAPCSGAHAPIIPGAETGPARKRGWILRYYLGDYTCADGFTALADGEAQALLHRNRGDQLHHDLDVVPGHHHLGALRQLHRSRDIGGAKVELRPIAFEERRVTAPLLLAQHIHFGLKLGVRRDAAGLAQTLPALHFLALRAPQEHPHVVPRLPLIQELP